MFKVARHAYLDEWRRRKRWEWVPFIDSVHKQKEMLSPNEQPETYTINRESESEMDQLCKQLNETYRTILYLREKEGLSYQEISDVLDLNENQVKVTLHRARKRLHDLATRNHFYERNENNDN